MHGASGEECAPLNADRSGCHLRTTIGGHRPTLQRCSVAVSGETAPGRKSRVAGSFEIGRLWKRLYAAFIHPTDSIIAAFRLRRKRRLGCLVDTGTTR